MRTRRIRRRIVGLIPFVGRTLLAACRWVVRHPQPLIIAAVAVIGGWGLWIFARSAEAFQVVQIRVAPDASLKLPESLIGTNLWRIDLRALADALHEQQPWLREVRVVRQLPNVLRVEPVERVPVAQVQLGRWYPVDDEGFILGSPGGEADERLVRLVGFGRAAALRTGRVSTDEQLLLALRVMRALRRAPRALWRRVTEVNVANAQQIRLLLDGTTEVRCGPEDELAMDLERLQAVLKAVAASSRTPEYIDVRFPDPVIGSSAS